MLPGVDGRQNGGSIAHQRQAQHYPDICPAEDEGAADGHS